MLDHTLGGTIWKIRPPVVSTIVFAVNMNHTRKHHLDGTVLISVTDGTVSKSLARPDLFITDAMRENVIGSRHRNRDTTLIGIQILLDSLILLSNIISRYYNPFFAFFPTSTLVLEWLVLLDQRCTSQVSDMPSLTHGSRNAHFYLM